MPRMVLRAYAALAAIVLPLSTSAAEAANLVKNGSFEQPVIASGFVQFNLGTKIANRWTVIGANGNVAVVSGTFAQNGFTFPAKKGANFLDLTGISNSATGIEQKVPTVAGQQYKLTFFVGNTVNPGGIFGTTSTVDVLIDGAQVFTALNKGGAGTTAQNWKKFAVTFTADNGRTTIAFVNGDAANDTANSLDGIELTPIP